MHINNLDIREGVNDAEIQALERLVESIAHPGMKIVEVGCWKGFTTAHLAELARKYDGMVYAIDHWQGNPGTANVTEAPKAYETFCHNLKVLELEKFVTIIKEDSIKAASHLPLDSLDFVFLDADHRYTPFKQDVLNYLALIRPGGVLCGHDCNGLYSKMGEDERRIIDVHLEEDYVDGYHCGITKALWEIFGENLRWRDGTIWEVTK